MKKVTLTTEDMEDVRLVAERVHARYEAEQVASTRFKQTNEKDRFRIRFSGLAAEKALAIAIGETWHRGDPYKPDVGDENEARWTGRFKDPELRVYDPDGKRSQDRGHLDRKFWLITGRPPVMYVHGWMYGRDVIKHGSKRINAEGDWSYYVPVIAIPTWPKPKELGDPLSAPRPCPSCALEHPIGTTCAGGWAPWP